MHECFLSLRSALLNVFLLYDTIKKKKNRMEGGREGGRVYGGKFGIRGFTNSTFFPASSYLVFFVFVLFVLLCDHFSFFFQNVLVSL